MSITDIGPQNVCHVALLALQEAEQSLVSEGNHTRLYAAIVALEEVRSFYAYPRSKSRERVAYALERLKLIESEALHLRADSLVQRGLSLSIHITQAALAGVAPFVEHALHESRLIVRLAEQEAAA